MLFTTQPVTAKNTLAYQNYLEKSLFFPFLADRYAPIQPTKYVGDDIQIIGINTDMDTLDLEFYGVLCDAKRSRRTGNPNHKLVEEYQDWFWNNR